MRERVQKPFGLGGDIGLSVSKAAPDSSEGWRISAGRDRPQSSLPRIGQILLALILVAVMAVGLHFFFY